MRHQNTYKKLKDEFLATHTLCAKCDKVIPLYGRTVHHKYGRLGKLKCWVPGWRMLCWKCHDWVHGHPAAARELGLYAPHGMWRDYKKAVLNEAH